MKGYICSTDEQLLLADYIHKYLKEKKGFNLKELMNDVYNDASSSVDENGETVGLAYAALVPFWAFKILSYDLDLADNLNVDFTSLRHADKKYAGNLEALRQDLGLATNPVVEVKKQDQRIKQDRLDRQRKNIIKQRKQIYAASPTMFATTGSEMKIEGGKPVGLDPEEVMPNDVVRKLLNDNFGSSIQFDPDTAESIVEYPGVGRVYLRVIRYSEFAKTEPVKNKKETATFILALVDQKGNYVYLNKDGSVGTKEADGKVPYWRMVDSSMKDDSKTFKTKLEFYARLKYGEGFNYIKPEQQKVIMERLQRERELVAELQALSDKDLTNPVILNIQGGSYGAFKSTNLNEFPFSSESPFYPVISPGESEDNPTPYFNYPSVNGKLYRFKAEDGLNNPDVLTITSLLFDDVYDKDGNKLDYKQKREEINKLIHIGYDSDLNVDGVMIHTDELYVAINNGQLVVKTIYDLNDTKAKTIVERLRLSLKAGPLTDISHLDPKLMRDIVSSYLSRFEFYHVKSKFINESSAYKRPLVLSKKTAEGPVQVLDLENMDYKTWIRNNPKFKILPEITTGENPYLVYEPSDKALERVYQKAEPEVKAEGPMTPAPVEKKQKPYDEGNEEALKMLEELGEANFNKIMKDHPELGTYDTKDVDELIADPTDDVSWNVKNEALIDYLNSEDITYQRIKSMLAKQDDYGQSGIELFDEDYDHVRSITLRELMDIIREDVLKVKPSAVYKGLQELPFDVPSERTEAATQDSIADEVDPLEALAKGQEWRLNKVTAQKRGNIKATPEQIKAAKKWFESSPLANHVKFKIMFNVINSMNSDSVATLTEAGITLYQGSDFSDLYHEGWHAFSQFFLTREERAELYKELSKNKGSFTDYNNQLVQFKNATEDQLEEYLAESFREYVLSEGTTASKPTPKKMNLFQRIYNLLKELFGGASYKDSILDPTRTGKVHEYFSKLRVGNITEFKYNVKNRSYGHFAWNKTIKLINKEDAANESFSYQDSKLVVDTIDSIFSRLADGRNRDKGTNRFTITMFSSDDNKKMAYSTAKQYFEKWILPNMRKKAAAATDPIEKSRYENLATLAQRVIDNFGDVNDLMENRKMESGVIYHHMFKSKVLTREDKEDFFSDDLDDTEAFIKGRESFDRGSQDSSLLDLAKPEVIHLLRSLFKYEEDKTVAKNAFGVESLGEFDKTWNFFAKELAGIVDAQAMYEKLQMMAKSGDYPIVGQLLDKLGDFFTEDQLNQKLWTSFWQAFNKPRVPLVQATLNELDDERFLLTVGYAQGASFEVERVWNNNFNSNTTRYIKSQDVDLKVDKLVISMKYLDTEQVLADFKGAKDPVKNKEYAYDFLKAIGLVLTDNKVIREKLMTDPILKDAVYYTYRRIKQLNDNNIKVSSIDDIFAEHTLTDKSVLGVQFNRYNNFKDLESKYGDTVSNFMVSNAEGNPQFEHSLNNTMLIVANAINTSGSKAELLKKSFMQHLDPKRNPWIKNSLLWRSLFDSDEFGAKRKTADQKNAELQIENLSGAKLIDKFGNEDGIASANADPFTRLIIDFHTTLLRGTPELMKHADKSSSFTAFVKYIVSYDAKKKQSSKYIDDADFLLTGDFNRPYDVEANLFSSNPAENSRGMENFYNILLGYLQSEVARIKMSQEILDDPTKPFDYKYAERGANFVVFDDIGFSPELKESIKAIAKEFTANHLSASDGSLDEFLAEEHPEMRNEIRNAIFGYLNNMADNVSEMFEKADYMDSGLINDIKNSVKGKGGAFFDKTSIKNMNVKRGAILSYVANNWVHNMETVIMLYGDLAQYDHTKEDFHKRNAGVASSGEVYRTDEAAIGFVNSVGNAYEKKYFPDKAPNGIGEDGTMNTAVLADTENQATHYEDYVNSMEQAFIKRFPEKASEARAMAQKTLKAYTEQKEGDGQGWISFDAYRSLLILQGNWDWVIQEKLYKDIVAGKDIDEMTTLKFFPVKKVQYWGPLKTEGLPVTAMHKFSLAPLIPNVIKDTNLELLHNRMIENDIHYALYESGSKIGVITDGVEKDQFYSDKDTKTFDKDGKMTKNTIFLHYLKDVLETNSEFKGKVTFPSQMRKLIIEGMVENGVPVDFKPEITDKNKRIEAWENASQSEKNKSPFYRRYLKYEDTVSLLTQMKYKELLDKISWKIGSDGKPTGSMNDLMHYVVRNLEVQDLAAHEIDFIQVINGRLKFDLSLSLSSDKIEKLLNALVVKQLIKQKISGEGLVQVSRSGWEKPTPADRIKYKGDDLPFYTLEEGAEKTSAMKVKIALQGDFKGLLNLESVVTKSREEGISRLQALNTLIKDEKWLDENDHRKMITMVACRIPTQGLNSMDFMEVFEFLPEQAGNIIIMPSEVVAKSGSDFDIDKMFTLMPNIVSKYGFVEYITHSKAKADLDIDQMNNRMSDLEKKKTEVIESYDEKIDKLVPLTNEEISTLKLLKHEYNIKEGKIVKKILDIKAKQKNAKGKEVVADDALFNAYAEIDILRNEYETKRNEMFFQYKDSKVQDMLNKRSKELKDINKELFDITVSMKTASSKGVENDLIDSMRDILSMPEVFLDLIRPNSTDIFDDVAADMKDFASSYDPTKTIDGIDRLNKKGKKSISGTRVLEVPYNIYKQNTNSVGKRFLGIAAVENTFNTLFNRIGMHLNPTAGMTTEEFNTLREEFKKTKNKKTKKKLKAQLKTYLLQRIALPHNTIIDKNGNEVISLSNLYDKDNNHRISDVINQIINGAVDIARDTWIFNVQGNQEIGPNLLFLVQSGVPVNHAVYFLSQPLIRQYVEKQRQKKSLFAKTFGTAPTSDNKFRYEAKVDMLAELGISARQEFEKDGQVIPYVDFLDVYDKTRYFVDNNPEAFDKDFLRKRLDTSKAEMEAGEIKVTDADKAIFLHFLEVEEMANKLKVLKLSANPDTSKAKSIFQASKKLLSIAEVVNGKAFPAEMVDKLTGDTVLSSFFEALERQQEIWMPYFKIRNNEQLRNYIMDLFKTPNIRTILEKTYDNPEKFADTFINDFMTFLFQNTLYKFDLQRITNYKGSDISGIVTPIQQVTSLKHGVFFKDGVVYVDKKRLERDYLSLDTKKNTEVAHVSASLFDNASDYYHFVFEREFLRSLYPLADLEDTFLYKDKFEFLQQKNKGLTQDAVATMAYEETLKDMALTNVFNIHHMFRGNETMLNKLELIKSKFPDLKTNYDVLQVLGPYVSKNVKNIKLYNRSTDSDSISVWNENIMELADPTRIRVEASYEDKMMIADFFRKMPFFSILQSGFDTGTSLSLQRMMPNRMFVQMMSESMYNYTKDVNPTKFTQEELDQFFARFMKVNSIGANPFRGKFKNYNTSVNLDTIDDLLYDDYDTDGKDDIIIGERPAMNVSTDIRNQKLFSVPATSSLEELDAFIAANPNLVFVINDAQLLGAGTDPLVNANQLDWRLKKLQAKYPDNIVGIVSRQRFSPNAAQALISDSTIKEYEKDLALGIERALYLRDQMGKTLIFNKAGYGQIQMNFNDGNPNEKGSSKKTSPLIFSALSKALYKNLGYINENYEDMIPESTSVLQEDMPITNQDVLDHLLTCRKRKR